MNARHWVWLALLAFSLGGCTALLGGGKKRSTDRTALEQPAHGPDIAPERAES